MSKKQTYEGIIAVARSGTGFLAHEKLEEDIIIYKEDLGTALNGDEVQVETVGVKRGRTHGKVVRVFSRAKERFIGTLQESEKGFSLLPDDQRMYARMRIKKIDAMGAKEGDKVVTRIERWKNAMADPVGIVERVLGPAGEHEVEMQSVILSKGFEEDFPAGVLKDAKEIGENRTIPKEEVAKRRDFRNVVTFTIDPEDAKDFDDALSIRTLKNGEIEVGIHIADVTHYVKRGSDLDKEARERATSIYLVDRVIPMLPEVLSNDVCSLVPHQDRLTFSAVFTFNDLGKVTSRWFGRTIIHSDKRFSYQDAQKNIDTKSGEYTEQLQALMKLSHVIRKGREKNGALSFETEEVRFKLDETGKPLGVFVKERLETMKMIEDFMLLANQEVAAWMANHSKDKKAHERTFIYRVHDAPDEERIGDLRIFLKAIGYDLGKENKQISAKDIDSVLREVKGTPQEQLINMATLRSMAKAVYTHNNIGHFSLAFEHYTHFTSPIRRYPDMMVHRILASHLEDDSKLTKKELESYQKAAITSSEREVAAVEAERDSVKYKQVEFMQDKVGQTFDVVVTGVAEHGIYVAEKETRSEGLIHISKLGDEYFTLDKRRYAVVGEDSGTGFRLGDELKATLVNADLESKLLDWKLA